MQMGYVWNSTLEAQEQIFLGNSQSPHSRHTVATQSPLQSPLQNTIVATEFSKKKGQVSFANQKLVATTVFSSGDCSGDCVATVWRLRQATFPKTFALCACHGCSAEDMTSVSP